MERDPEMNPDLFEGDIMGVLPGKLVRTRNTNQARRYINSPRMPYIKSSLYSCIPKC